MKLQSTYNCVLASVYNYLTQVYPISFQLEMMLLDPEYLSVKHGYKKMISAHPKDMAQRFLTEIGGRMVFPDASNMEGALLFADRHLQEKGILPVAINLRYSVLDPAPFDNDVWNFQLLVERMDRHHYAMFDMFHGTSYTVHVEHLQRMIDTPFNYRHEGQFTPFMTIELAQLAHTQQVLREGHALERLLAALEAYSSEQNRHEGSEFIKVIRSSYLDTPSISLYDEIYRVMGFQIIIAKSREQFLHSAASIGIPLTKQDRELVTRWETFNHLVAMTISRKNGLEYDRLLQMYEELIAYETLAVERLKQRALHLLKKGDLNGDGAEICL